MNLYEKLIEVRKQIPYLQKSNKGYQFQYVSSSQTLDAVRPLLDKHGILIIPEAIKQEVIQKETAKGVRYLTLLDLLYTIIDANNPSDHRLVRFQAQGLDDGEKGIGKALTYGEKCLLLKLFNVPTDLDDPDQHQTREDPPIQSASVERRATLTMDLPERIKKALNVFKPWGLFEDDLSKYLQKPVKEWKKPELDRLSQIASEFGKLSDMDRAERVGLMFPCCEV